MNLFRICISLVSAYRRVAGRARQAGRVGRAVSLSFSTELSLHARRLLVDRSVPPDAEMIARRITDSGHSIRRREIPDRRSTPRCRGTSPGWEGHDASHVRALGLAGCTDDEVMARALAEERVLVTTDTDFGTILALTGAAGPSVLLLRGVGDSTPERVAALLAVLPRIDDELSQGAVVVVEEDRYRIRYLPIDDS